MGFILVLFLFFYPLQARSEIVDRVVAVVGNEMITQGDVNEALALHTSELHGLPNGPEREARIAGLHKDVLDELIRQKLLASKIKESKIEVNDQDLSNSINKILSGNHMSLEALKQELAKNGTSLYTYKEKLRDELKQYKFIQKEIEPKVQISDGDIADYYSLHASEFQTFKQLRFAQILLEPSAARDEKASLELAQKLKQDIEAKKTSFAAAAKAYSQGPAAAAGGDSGWVDAKDINLELLRVLSGLKPMTLSDPLSSNAGVLLIQLEDHKDSTLAPLASVKREIQDSIYKTKMDAALTQYLLSLRDHTYVRIVDAP